MKKVIIPTLCFAVLSTVAFEESIQASTIVKTATTDTVNTYIKTVNINTGSNLNLRKEPSIHSQILSKLKKGTEVNVYEESNGWARVSVDGKEGFISVNFLASPTTTTGIINSVSTVSKYVNVKAGSSLNMRQSPTTSAKILSKLSKDTVVAVLNEKDGWAQIKVNGIEGYVSTQYLRSSKTSTTETKKTVSSTTTKLVNVAASSNLNMRTSPTTSSAIILKLKKGKEVTVNSESKGWSKINVDGKEGYVSSEFLITKKIESPKEETTTTSEQPEQAITMYVNVSKGSNLNMRSNMSTSSSIILKIASGTKVSVLSTKNGWSKIAIYGKEGYVSSQYLSETNSSSTKPTVVKTIVKYVDVSSNSSLNLRSSASTNSTITAKLTKGTEVKVLSEFNGWSKVQANEKIGYVSSKYLSAKLDDIQEEPKIPTEDEIVDEQITTSKYINVEQGSSLKMRNNPLTTASVIVNIARGVKVQVLSESNGWSKINVYNHEGFVKSEYLSVNKPETIIAEKETETPLSETDITTKYVNVSVGSSLNMRSAASTSASVITKISRGTVVTIHSQENGWSKVSANGQVGYVSTQYLSTTEVNNTGKLNGTITKSAVNYELSLNDFTNIQMAVKPQTDKKYTTYIREDALVFKNSELPTAGTVNGDVWNVRGGAGTNYWVVGQVTDGQTLQILSKTKDENGYIWYEIQFNKTWVNSSPEDVKYYLNPDNFSSHPVDSLQFLKLSETTNIDINEVNDRILAGRGILTGQAATFVAAGEMYGINELYLISHALLETGNGGSELANGVKINGKTVYNMYGIGAYDSNALISGAEYAYKAGWFTPEAAIIGGAEFIAKRFINAGQDTIYKMRWNPAGAMAKGYSTHQYATDIGWASKQVKQIYNLYSLLDSYQVTLEIPEYK
jgi:mannosyl-glycoprotein endo-beta-N-acetylglucosaminidase